MWASLIGAGLSLLSNNANTDKVVSAQQAGQDKANGFYANIYNDQRNLLTNNMGAYNKLADIYGVPHFNAGNGGSANGLAYTGSANNVGTGDQRNLSGKNASAPLDSFAQDTGLTKRNPSLYNGLVRGDLSGFLDPQGLISKEKGDNWTSLWSQPDSTMDYLRYWNDNPDLANDPNGWNKPDVQKLFNGDKDAYLKWHYENFGQQEGRQLHTVADSQAAQNAAAGTDANGVGKFDMNEFWQSPNGLLATSGFRGVDTPAINASFATGGKLLSGAQKKALDDRGRARAEGAFGDYTNGLRSQAGLAQTTSGALGNYANQYGTSLANGALNMGNINAAAQTQKNNNWNDFLKNAGGSIYGATGSRANGLSYDSAGVNQVTKAALDRNMKSAGLY